MKNHKKLKIALFFITIMLIISGLVYVEFHFLFLTPFSRKMIENKFGISVSNGISLKRYKVKYELDGATYTLEIENISNYEKFMEDNVYGKITEHNDKYYHYYAYYVEKSNDFVQINFYEKDDGYKATAEIVP